MPVRDLRAGDIDRAVEMHRTIMAGEFLPSCGARFLRVYYRTWLVSPAAIALVATEPQDELIGLLLGSTAPSLHYRAMVRSGGTALAVALVAHAVAHPRWGVALTRRRGARYARGLVRMARRRPHAAAPAGDAVAEPVAEITHLMVSAAARGRGTGRALVQEAVRRARSAAAQRLVVVTPPGWAAAEFYRRLGFTEAGAITTASGERFVRYALALAGP